MPKHVDDVLYSSSAVVACMTQTGHSPFHTENIPNPERTHQDKKSSHQPQGPNPGSENYRARSVNVKQPPMVKVVPEA